MTIECFLNDRRQVDFIFLLGKGACIRPGAPQGQNMFHLCIFSTRRPHAPGVARSQQRPLPESSWEPLGVNATLLPEAEPSSELVLSLSLHSGCNADLGGSGDPLQVLEGVVAAVHASVDQG